MTEIAVSAPGKVLIAGEYAVLEGADAIVAAVQRRAYAFLSDDTAIRGVQSSLPLEASQSKAAAERIVGEVPLRLSVDVSELRYQGKKLGLGSSSAAAAAAAAAVFAYHGHDLGEREVRERVMEAALAGHRTIIPLGSGVDVAAASLGGLIRFRQEGKSFQTFPLTWPQSLHLRVVWTGEEANTGELIKQVRDLARRDPSGYDKLMKNLSDISCNCLDALIKAEVSRVIRALTDYALGMDALGRAAGARSSPTHCEPSPRQRRRQAARPSPRGRAAATLRSQSFPSSRRPSASSRPAARSVCTRRMRL